MTGTAAKPLLIVAGPTASGKTSRAIDLAKEKNGEIVGADALQIYRDLPILTAQPTAEEKARAPHHLFGLWAADERGSVQRWLDFALPIIRDIWARGKTPIVTGGTGFYLKTLQTGLSPIPEIPDGVRKAARDLHRNLGTPGLYEHLRARDPKAAEKLDPANPQRLLRALEVFDATGQSLIDWQAVPATPPLPEAHITTLQVIRPRAELHARARARLDQMIKDGVVDEIRDFDARTNGAPLPPTHALGYTPLLQAAKGEIKLDRARDRAAIETNQYIKRQETFLRHQMTFDGKI